MTDTEDPRRTRVRNGLRVAGVVLTASALVLLISGFVTFSNSQDGSGFGLFVAGMPLLAVGGWCLNAGFLGAVARLAAEETAPAVRTMGSALFGQLPPPSVRGNGFCPRCGAARGAADAFCSSCGNPLAAPPVR